MPSPNSENTKINNTRRMVFLAVLVALASVLHVVEMLFPSPIPIPGAKLGLANVVTLVALSAYGLREGLIVASLRVVIGSLAGGTFLGVAFVLSLSGALLSTLVMEVLLKKVRSLSVIGVSVAGAIAHNIGQLAAVSLLISTGSIFYYLPFLLLFAVPTGFATGVAARLVIKRLPEFRLQGGHDKARCSTI